MGSIRLNVTCARRLRISELWLIPREGKEGEEDNSPGIMTVGEVVFLSLLISACGIREDGKEGDGEPEPKALPFYFAKSSNESSLAKFLKEWTDFGFRF